MGKVDEARFQSLGRLLRSLVYYPRRHSTQTTRPWRSLYRRKARMVQVDGRAKPEVAAPINTPICGQLGPPPRFATSLLHTWVPMTRASQSYIGPQDLKSRFSPNTLSESMTTYFRKKAACGRLPVPNSTTPPPVKLCLYAATGHRSGI